MRSAGVYVLEMLAVELRLANVPDGEILLTLRVGNKLLRKGVAQLRLSSIKLKVETRFSSIRFCS
jgi:hypothetical protein